VESDDELDDEGSSGPLLPPDDRLWRHPSELASARKGRSGGAAAALVGGPAGQLRPAPGRIDTRLWPIVILSAAIGGLLATGILYASGVMRSSKVTVALERDVDSSPTVMARTSTFVVAAERVRPSCVVLVATGSHGTRVADGVVFRSDGMLLTTARALDGATELSATVGGGRRVAARVVATDPASGLAVVKMTGSSFVPAPLGSALDVRVGDPVITVHPPSKAPDDVPGDQASIGALGQEVAVGNARIADLMRVDTTVAPSVTGGAVIDSHGVVVGITTAVGSGDAYATPIDLARQIATELLTAGRVVRVWLGVQGVDLSASAALAMHVNGGAVITRVDAGSPAAGAGLQPGDVVVGIDNRAVTSMANLVMAVHSEAPGTRVELDVDRDGRLRATTVAVTPRPADAD
jgi:S1-C subfamily serine protease